MWQSGLNMAMYIRATPEKLIKKHSSGDLHSRLKTRKLLGVGETDDGDVHRSKLSQILGHSEQLYVKLPKGLRIWQVLLAVMFSVIGLWALVCPRNLFSFALTAEADDAVVLPIRLYGSALITLSVIFWFAVQSSDKDMIRWSLLASALYFVLQFIVTSMTLAELGQLFSHGPRLLTHRLIFSTISFLYYFNLSGRTLRLRPANENTTTNALPKGSMSPKGSVSPKDKDT